MLKPRASADETSCHWTNPLDTRGMPCQHSLGLRGRKSSHKVTQASHSRRCSAVVHVNHSALAAEPDKTAKQEQVERASFFLLLQPAGVCSMVTESCRGMYQQTGWLPLLFFFFFFSFLLLPLVFLLLLLHLRYLFFFFTVAKLQFDCCW